MKIALPTSQGKLCAHFVHCEEFAMIEADGEKKEILKSPPHEPVKLPLWFKDKSVTIVIAGGMGMKAQQIFNTQGISVIVGASAEDHENIVMDYLNKKLKTGENVCNH